MGKVDVRTIVGELRKASTSEGSQEKVSTGVLGLDLMLYGGFSFGSIHELYGLSKTGKSLIGLQVIRELHRKYDNAIAVILDGENAHKNYARMKSLGLDLDRLIIVPKKTIPTIIHCYEKILEILHNIEFRFRLARIDALEKDEKKREQKKSALKEEVVVENIGRKILKDSPPIIFFIDSIPSFPEQIKLVEDQGRRAKRWHETLRRLTGILDEKTMIIATNHIIYNPSQFGSGESKTTGVAIDYYRDDGVKLMNYGKINKNGKIMGYWLLAEVEKTRDGIIHNKTFFPVYFIKNPVHKYAGVLPLASLLGLAKLNNKSAWTKKGSESDVFPNFSYNGKVYQEGRYDKDYVNLIEKGDIVEKIKEELLW